MKFRPIRVLPLTIGVAVLLLGVQAGSLWNAFPMGVATPAFAEEAAEKMAAKEEHAGEEAGHGTDGKGGDHADDDDKKDVLADYTQEEIEILYELAERRETLDQREAELASREALIDAAEKRMEARVMEMQGLRSSIEALLKQYDQQEREELLSVVKIYETMKPKDAAAILQKLEMPVLLSIVETMSERRSSAVLAAMEPARAREVTAEMARKRTVDLSRMNPGGNPG